MALLSTLCQCQSDNSERRLLYKQCLWSDQRRFIPEPLELVRILFSINQQTGLQVQIHYVTPTSLAKLKHLSSAQTICIVYL